jgi:hypothetical protein
VFDLKRFRRFAVASFVVAVAAVILGNWSNTTYAAIDTCTWTGASNSSWSNSGNWTGCDNGNLPQAGDRLVFPDGASNTTNTNNFPAGRSFQKITIGSGYSIGGNNVTLSAFNNGGRYEVLAFTGTGSSFNINATVSPPVNNNMYTDNSGNNSLNRISFTQGRPYFINRVAGAELSFNGPISAANETIFSASNSSLIDTVFTLNGNSISWAGGFFATDSTEVVATNPNSFGTGALRAYNNGAISFAINQDVTISNSIQLGSMGPSNKGGLNRYGGYNVTLTGGLGIFREDNLIYSDTSTDSNSGVFIFDEVISGPYAPHLISGDYDAFGYGNFVMTGSASNTYSGTTIVDKGTSLITEKTGTAVAITGNLDIIATDNASSIARIGSLNGGGTDNINDTALINLISTNNYSATAELANKDELIGTIIGAGVIHTDDNSGIGGITIGGGDNSGVVTGEFTYVTNTPKVTKVGTGTWDISGLAESGLSTSGQLDILGGTVIVGEELTNLKVTIDDSATLQGVGRLDDVSPLSGGTLTIGGVDPGCLTFHDLVLESGSSYQQDITGTDNCSGYDQARTTGEVTINGATLNITQLNGFNPAVGAVLTIIDSDEGLTGEFNGLPEGTVFEVDGVLYKISYLSSKVTLTVMSEETEVTGQTPSGTSSSNSSASDSLGSYGLLASTGQPLTLALILSTILIPAASIAKLKLRKNI